jgi:hypothetical protein
MKDFHNGEHDGEALRCIRGGIRRRAAALAMQQRVLQHIRGKAKCLLLTLSGHCWPPFSLPVWHVTMRRPEPWGRNETA